MEIIRAGEESRWNGGSFSSINKVSRFLAARDLPALSKEQVEATLGGAKADLLILLGNSMLFVTEQAARAYRSGVAERLMIVGGIGHSTPDLIRHIREHPRYADIDTSARSEAEMLLDAAAICSGVERDGVLLETDSTNCGANAINALQTLERAGENPRTVILMQDPTMQLRTGASFRKTWREGGRGETKFYDYAAFVPQVTLSNRRLLFDTAARVDDDGLAEGSLWDMPRFLSLIMGEMSRLIDDENGYGPRGKGYIDHVDIPSDVMAAYHVLLPGLRTCIRPAYGGNV